MPDIAATEEKEIDVLEKELELLEKQIHLKEREESYL